MAFVGDAESERVIRRTLPELAAEADSVCRGGVAKAIEHLTEHRSPALLIVDISGQELPLSKIHRLSEACEPGVQVIAIGDCNEISLYRDLVQSGIADYVVKPLTIETVSRAVEVATCHVAGTAVSQKVGNVIAVMGTRGGIGTTTVAVNLAWNLANRAGRRVALVDLDLQTGDCGLMLDLKPTSALREALENSSRVDKLYLERVMVPHGDRLFVLNAEESLRDELRFAPDGVEKLITALQSDFHYVVIDVPRLPSAATHRAIEIAALRVLVADETIRSAREIVRLRGVLGQGRGTERNLLVINFSGERRPGYIPRKEFLDTIEMQAALAIPLMSKSHASSAHYGEPQAAHRGPIAQAIETLAGEISGRPAAPGKWWPPWR
jgi:pilus assembly protein CpaE